MFIKILKKIHIIFINTLAIQLACLHQLNAINLTGNALSASNCFTTIPALSGSDMATINSALLALKIECIQIAFEQMGPAQFSAATNVSLLDAASIRSTYSKHLQNFSSNKNPPRKKPICIGNDSFVEWQKQGSAFGYNDTTFGTTIGADYCMHNGILGSAFSYTHDTVDARDSGSSATINGYYGGLYSRWIYDKLYMNIALIGAFSCYKTIRQLNFGTINRDAFAHHNGNGWLIHGGFEYQLENSRFEWNPYINVDFIIQRERGYTESGADSLNLHVQPKNTHLLQTEVGLSFNKNYRVLNGILIPTLSVAYINQSSFSNKNYYASFANSYCMFKVEGENYEQNLFASSLVLSYQGSNDIINVSIFFDSQLGSNYWSQDIGFDLTFRF